MKLIRSGTIALALGAGAPFTPAHAQEGGPYLGGALGQSTFKEWCTGETATARFDACDDQGQGWKVFGGYRFNRYMAAEATYVDWGDVTARVLALGTPIDVAASQRSYGIAAVGTLPIGERFEVFGKLGFLRNEVETRRVSPNPTAAERNETEPHYGVGVKYGFTRNWVMRGEWERTDNLDIDMLSIGVEYRF